MSLTYITPQGLLIHKPAIDAARVAKAYREKAPARRRAAPTAILPAASPGACRRCGIPGRKGCDHQAPYVPAGIEVSGVRSRTGPQTGHRF